jgi:hypothetical protein
MLEFEFTIVWIQIGLWREIFKYFLSNVDLDYIVHF